MLESWILERVHFPGSHTQAWVADMLMEAVDQFQIKDRKEKAIICDQTANVQLAGENFFLSENQVATK